MGCRLPHLQSQAVPQHISAMRKASLIKFVLRFWNSELVFIRGTHRLFSLKYLFGEAKIA